MFAPWYPDDMPRDVGTRIYIYCKIQLDSSTGLVGAVLKSKCNHTTCPFLRIYYMVIYYGNLLGSVWGHITRTWSVDSLGQQVPRSPGSGILVPCGHGQIFGLHRCGMGCHRHWCQGIPLNSWCGRNSWGLFHLSC